MTKNAIPIIDFDRFNERYLLEHENGLLTKIQEGAVGWLVDEKATRGTSRNFGLAAP